MCRVLCWLALWSVFAGAGNASAQVSAIKKCQDADGNWHYGDYAAEQCAQSKINKIDRDTGVNVGVEDLPPTPEEISARQAKKARAAQEQQRMRQQRMEDDRLLFTYDTEQHIINARDQHLIGIDNEIAINEELAAQFADSVAQLESHLDDPSLSAEQRKPIDDEIRALRWQIRAYESASAAKLQEKIRVQDLDVRYR